MSNQFSCCVIIPVYNHQKKIATIVTRLLSFNLSVMLIDDGSEPECAGILREVAIQDRVQLIRLDKNSGKGVAVCRGLREAFNQGFTHGLQIDADGQHDLGDIPRFVATARAYPDTVISGARAYKDMPPSRRRGRRFNDFWVCVNSLSLQLKDSMCGYRLYPLAHTMKLLDRRRVGERMSFDTDILVRLYWRGLDVINIPTGIIYANEIPSHFDLFWDNVRITWMHINLLIGMVPRSLGLILRKKPTILLPAASESAASL